MGELWGITGDGWVAIATLLGGLAVLVSAAAVYLKAGEFLGEQEARDVRRYLVDDGVWKMRESLDLLLQTIRQNYATSQHLIRLLRSVPPGSAGAPSPSDLPRLIALERGDLAFQAIRPTSRALNCTEIGELATRAFARLYNVQAILTAEVEQTIRTCYGPDPGLSDEALKTLADRLEELVVRKYKEAEGFKDLSAWLEDAGLRIQELRISRFNEIGILHADETILALADKIRDMKSEVASEEAP